MDSMSSELFLIADVLAAGQHAAFGQQVQSDKQCWVIVSLRFKTPQRSSTAAQRSHITRQRVDDRLDV
jgi:hypothetical protein